MSSVDTEDEDTVAVGFNLVKVVVLLYWWCSGGWLHKDVQFFIDPGGAVRDSCRIDFAGSLYHRWLKSSQDGASSLLRFWYELV